MKEWTKLDIFNNFSHNLLKKYVKNHNDLAPSYFIFDSILLQ